MKRKIFSAFLLTVILAINSLTVTSSAVCEDDLSVFEQSKLDATLNKIASEYIKDYPQYREKILDKINSFLLQDSFVQYYNSNPQEAISNVVDVIDSYIQYKINPCEFTPDRAVTGSSSNVVYYVNCPWVEQDNGYYCGPACIYMTVEGIRNHIPGAINNSYTNTQSANATAMGTTSSDGTSELEMRNRLKNMTTKKYKVDYLSAFEEDEFIYEIKMSLYNNGPVILMIHNPYLSYYPSSYGYTSNHYIVVKECISYSNGTYGFWVNDPNCLLDDSLQVPQYVTSSDLFNHSTAIIWC